MTKEHPIHTLTPDEALEALRSHRSGPLTAALDHDLAVQPL